MKIITSLKNKIRSVSRYYKSHIWIEILTSVLLVTAVLLGVFYVFLQKQYYHNIIKETEKSDAAVLSVSANAMSNLFSEQLHIGAEIAVNNTLYELVHEAEKNKEFTYSDERLLKNELSAISVYSDAIASIAIITKSGLLYEYARYWGYDTPYLWTGDHTEIIEDLYEKTMEHLSGRKPGYYLIGTEPLLRETMPVMPLFHIAFPLLGGYRSFNYVDAAVVVTYNMESIAESSLMGSEKMENTSRYITDADGKIIFHESPEYIGMSEADYLAGEDLDVSRMLLQQTGWNINIGINQQQIRRNVRQMYRNSSMVYVIVILLVFLMWQILLRSILKPVDIMKKSMEELEHGKRKKIRIQGEHELWLLAGEYNAMIDALSEQQLMVQKEYQEKVAMSELRNQAERIALESQINAHFIFNTLNAINYNAMESGNMETSRLIKRLSNILQYTLSSQAEVTLGTEFDMAMEYLYLQKFRLMDKFEYEIRFPEEYSEWPCCKVFLQPIVENSIVHGFESIDSGGKIWICGEAEADRFRVEIGDNGCGMNRETCALILESLQSGTDFSFGEKGIALRNVITRMRMFYGRRFEMKLTSAPGEGTVFVFYLPIPETDKEEEV